jgi:CRISPR-associated protein Csb2
MLADALVLTESRLVHAFELTNSKGASIGFNPRKVMHVAAWLRHAAHQSAKNLDLDKDFIEHYVCGHGESKEQKNYRFTYLPLASVGNGYLDGRLRRALLVEPFGKIEPHAQTVKQTLPNTILVDEVGQPRAKLQNLSTEDSTLRCYLQPSTTWGSVTPVVLPGFDEKKEKKAIGLIAKALVQAGYKTPVTEISVQEDPIFEGAQRAEHYFVPGYQERWPRVHAMIKFAEPIAGPLAIGTGRHSGLGVFASLI